MVINGLGYWVIKERKLFQEFNNLPKFALHFFAGIAQMVRAQDS